MFISSVIFVILCIGFVGFVLPYLYMRESKNTKLSKEILDSFDIKETEDNLDEMIEYFKKNGLPKYKL